MDPDYGWNDARLDLEAGINPSKVARLMGESVEYIREVAEMHGWPVRWSGQTAQQSLDAGERWL